MEQRKISFGFKKTNKPNSIINKQRSKQENDIEFIKCLEEKQIQPVVEKEKKSPLVIAMKENQKTSTALASLMRRRAVLFGEKQLQENDDVIKSHDNVDQSVSSEPENLESRAARELLTESKQTNLEVTQGSQLVLPIIKADDLELNGAKESTLDDYDNIPIQEYGLAMLRGMGWIEPPKKKLVDDEPIVRPKGMGLGADKSIKPKKLLIQPAAGEILEIKRNAFVRILAGKRKDCYGQIESFDEYAGRVFVKLAIGGIKESFNEFLCQPVSKKEYEQYSKCINNTKFEEYKSKKINLEEMNENKKEKNIYESNLSNYKKNSNIQTNNQQKSSLSTGNQCLEKNNKASNSIRSSNLKRDVSYDREILHQNLYKSSHDKVRKPSSERHRKHYEHTTTNKKYYETKYCESQKKKKKK